MYKYEIIIIPNDQGGFYVRIPDIPSIFTGGMSEEEALRNAREAINEYVRICKQEGLPVPRPTSYSGKFNVRIPKTLHRELAERAAEEGVSLNQLVVSWLSMCSRAPVLQVSSPRRTRKRKERSLLVG